MSTNDTAPTPDDLEDAGAALWQAVTETYDLDVSELALLAHCAASKMSCPSALGTPRRRHDRQRVDGPAAPVAVAGRDAQAPGGVGQAAQTVALPQSDDDAGEDKPRWIAPDVAHERAKKAAAARWGKVVARVRRRQRDPSEVPAELRPDGWKRSPTSSTSTTPTPPCTGRAHSAGSVALDAWAAELGITWREACARVGR